MALSMQEFIEKTKCEQVCDQMIVGIGPNRKMVGYIKDGTFSITDEGHEYLAALDAPPETVEPTVKRRKKAEDAAE